MSGMSCAGATSGRNDGHPGRAAGRQAAARRKCPPPRPRPGAARAGAAVNRGGAAGIDALDGGFRDGVGVFTKVVFDAVFFLADLVGPDGASILKMDDVGGRGKRRQKH